MRITEVRVKLMEDPDDRLQAFCSITLDNAFVVRDLKIIAGTTGPFVAMPSRKLTANCSKCGCKNHLRASYCNQCGTRQNQSPPSTNDEQRPKLYADVAHPINSACREMIQKAVVEAFEDEKKLAVQPDYVSRYDELGDAGDYDNPEPKKTSPGINEPTTRDNPTKPNTGSRRKDEPSSSLNAKSKQLSQGKKRVAEHRGDDGDFGDGVF